MNAKLRTLFATFLLVILLVSSCVTNGYQVVEANFKGNETVKRIVFEDSFSEGKLKAANWHVARKGDFRESTIDVYDVDPTEKMDYRLRLRADTIGTADNTVKFHGVRSLKKIDFNRGVIISFSLDWNNQSNGSYLTAGIYLCPIITDGNPRDENNWLKFEYIGVPPGRNARAVVAAKVNGRTIQLYTEGWPKKQRTGRCIGNQRISIILEGKSFKVIENDREICKSEPHYLTFTTAYLYLQMSSHSNYPGREIYFDDIVIAKRSYNNRY